MTKRDESILTDAQIEQGRVWRFEHALPWCRVGKWLGCNTATIRKHLDPEYKIKLEGERSARYMRAKEKRAKLRERIDEQTEREIGQSEMVNADLRFQALMRTAIKEGREHASDGVCTRPSTEYPRYRRVSPAMFSQMSSPAAMCADLGADI